MTAVSIAKQHEFTCPSCGHASSPVVWVAIDLIERPDLKPDLASGACGCLDCPSCSASMTRVDPLLVTRLDPVAPVLLVVSAEEADIGEALKSADPVMRQVQAALGSAASTTPGPVVPLTFGALSLAVTRDLARDLEHQDPPLLAATEECRGEYERFLERIRQTSDRRHLQLALGLLHQVVSRAGLEKLFRDYPELLTDAALTELAAGTDQDDETAQRHMKARRALLADAATGSTRVAWKRFKACIRREWPTYWMPQIRRLTSDISAAGSRGNWESLLRSANDLAVVAKSVGMEPLEVRALMSAGSALLEISVAGRPDRVEQAITYLEEAQTVVDRGSSRIPRDLAVTVLSHLAVAYGMRVEGDPGANQMRAVECLRRALLLAPHRDRDLRALLRTNLAFCLIALATELTNVDESKVGPDDAEAVRRIEEAIGELTKALKWRTFRRNPLDWGYTKTNLGFAYAHRPQGDRVANLEQAIAHYSDAVRGFSAASESHLAAHAKRNLSAAEFGLAQVEAGDAHAGGPRLERALRCAQEALAERPATVAPIEAGRAWLQIGRIHEATNDTDSAIDAYARALATLTPVTAARDCRAAARALANLISDRDGWGAAADVWETAAEAAAQAANMCTTAGARLRELHAHADVFRLAGFALASSGNYKRAVEVIELGRARELSTWMEGDVVDEAVLRSLSPSLCERFFALRAQLDELDRLEDLGRPGMLTMDAAALAEGMASTIDEIRKLPGFERLLMRPSFAEIAATPEPGQAIAYLATAPVGCAVLVVGATTAGPVLVHLMSDSPDSGRVVRIILDLDERAGILKGYAWAQWTGDDEELVRTLEELSKALGETILRPLAELLREHGFETVCLVPAGLLGLLPLHALSWKDQAGEQCLLDGIEVTYAPSAFTEAICRRRAARRSGGPRRLLAVGNPLPQDPPLPGAEREAQMVADLFAEDSTTLLLEQDATKSIVLASMSGATHIHLACHGAASWPNEALTAQLLMAHGEPITGNDLLAIEAFEPRLVVASACQTGVMQGYETVDQALSLGTVFLGAGAAAAVATLWPVDDYATALLMCHFYESYLGSDDAATAGRPAAALRAAQLWLRDLTPEAEERYLEDHPTLRHHRDSSRAHGDMRRVGADSVGPYESMVTWAPFLVFGA
jgi:tetratricopeptide (TPR) repeat protein